MKGWALEKQYDVSFWGHLLKINKFNQPMNAVNFDWRLSNK
jgi:hypothetical protein